MSDTFTVRITVPAGYMQLVDPCALEEAIAEAAAETHGESLPSKFDDGEYNASIDFGTWRED